MTQEPASAGPFPQPASATSNTVLTTPTPPDLTSKTHFNGKVYLCVSHGVHSDYSPTKLHNEKVPRNGFVRNELGLHERWHSCEKRLLASSIRIQLGSH